MSLHDLLRRCVTTRLPPAAAEWLATAEREVSEGGDETRFAVRFSGASRGIARGALAPTAEERATLATALPGLEIERWSLLEAARVVLLLARRDLATEAGAAAVEAAFRFADEGELCALCRSLALLPAPERFVWRAGEGCRSNMRSVFEAVACDTPFPARWFDELAFRQCVLKAVFVGAPVARIHGLASRRNAELTRMALDFAEERRSAGRPVPADLWLTLGPGERDRALASIALELSHPSLDEASRRAALDARARVLATGAPA